MKNKQTKKQKPVTLADISAVMANLEIGKDTTFNNQIHIQRKNWFEWDITKVK
jgi:hypothetical protein